MFAVKIVNWNLHDLRVVNHIKKIGIIGVYHFIDESCKFEFGRILCGYCDVEFGRKDSEREEGDPEDRTFYLIKRRSLDLFHMEPYVHHYPVHPHYNNN